MELTEMDLVGKTIQKISVDRYEVNLVFTDGTSFIYSVADGGYSSWEVLPPEGGSMCKYFPNDCPMECPYLRRYDMSVDDYTNICVLLKMQIDDCDSDFQKCKCPLESKGG